MKNQLLFLVTLLLVGFSFQACQKEEPQPKAMSITSIEVLRYPAPSNGGGWDLSTNPDLYAAIVKGTGVDPSARVTSTRVDATLPTILPLNGRYTVNDFNFLLTIAIYDQDDFDPDDFVGYVSFFPSGYTDGTPSSFTVAEGQTEFRISVDWEF